MKVIYKIIIYISIAIGILFLFTTISNYRNKVIIDTIIEKGNKKIGIVEFVDSDRSGDILIQVDGKIISKDVVESDNFHAVGDTVIMFNHEKYEYKYIFEYDDIDGSVIIFGSFMTILFLLPAAFLLKRKQESL